MENRKIIQIIINDPILTKDNEESLIIPLVKVSELLPVGSSVNLVMIDHPNMSHNVVIYGLVQEIMCMMTYNRKFVDECYTMRVSVRNYEILNRAIKDNSSED